MSFMHRTVSSSSMASREVKPPKVMPTRAEDYELCEEIGQGVYRAICKPTNEVVAIKVLDLERQDPGKLEEIRKEAATMSLLNHPNLVSCYCSFNLWVIMPYFAGGSVLNIMKWGHPQGLDETTIATIMEPVLKALSYFHRNGNIHRDIKAGNILIDDHGNVKLADYGVATSGFDSFGPAGAHQTFVGTPCWMAPEVMEQSAGYDQQADIWSLGITLLELAHGHAPFAKYPPMKVLMMTLQNPPPTLEADSGTHHFGRHLRDLVAQCLQKDPRKRPSAKTLMEHRFFSEKAKKPDYLQKTLLDGLPSLGERVRLLAEREAARRGAATETDIKSQTEYVRGVSNWNFSLDDLRAEAAATGDAPKLPGVPEGGSPRADAPPSSTAGGFASASAAAAPPPPPSSSSAAPPSQTKGRFEVYEAEAEAGPPPPDSGVRRGRFTVEELPSRPPAAAAASTDELAGKLRAAGVHE